LNEVGSGDSTGGWIRSEPVVEAMRKAGLYRMSHPQAIGGQELDPVSIFKVVEEVTRHDSAAGASAIRNQYRFQQYFRDVHTITQHAHGSASRYESVGALMVGEESDWGFFVF
jgi:alkylation response protein AidB-like acyl-CoA dehydrogenase